MSSAPETLKAAPRSSAPLDFVEARVNHLIPAGEKSAVYIVPPGEGQPNRPAEYDSHLVRIQDARPLVDELTLDREGLILVHSETAVKDFLDDEEVEATYYPEVEAMMKDVTGATKVVVFDHTVRIQDEAKSRAKGVREPVRVAHNDYTPKSGPQRVRDLLPDEAEDLLKGRYAVINVWRPIKGPVEAMPIAVADAQSMGPDDFIATDLVYADRVGEIYDVAYNPDQRWYYFPQMGRDEALLLKCYDSKEDGRARFTAHTAFEDPTSPEDAAPRESIEIRTLVFFPDDN